MVAINHTLTNYARGIMQDRSKGLASFVCPFTSTGGFASGQYLDFNDSNSFRIYNTKRAQGGPTQRITFDAESPFYNCSPHGLEIAIDDFEREKAGKSDPLGLEKAKIDTLLSAKAVSHEYQIWTAIAAAKAAEGGVGNWSSADVDPIAEIDALIGTIALDTGMMPNRMAISLATWTLLRHNAKVIARQPGAAVVGATTAQIAAMTINPGLDIRIGVMSYDTAKRGASAASKVNIMGSDAYLFIGQDSPSLYDPAFAKAFTSGESGVDSVTEYRDDNANSDVYKVPWSVDIKVVGSICAKRITAS